MKSIALKCPQCGANLKEKCNRCEFCGTSVKLSNDKQHFVSIGLSCPECDANNQIDDKHCGNCGCDLVANCPVPNCLEPNSVWKKFCKKCGCNIAETRIGLLEEANRKFEKDIEYHLSEMKRIEKRLPESKSRETLVKFFIGVVGAIIAFAFLSAGDGGWIGTFIVGLITLGIVAGYKSSEEYNLLASMAVHQDDLERASDKREINSQKLELLKEKQE